MVHTAGYQIKHTVYLEDVNYIIRRIKIAVEIANLKYYFQSLCMDLSLPALLALHRSHKGYFFTLVWVPKTKLLLFEWDNIANRKTEIENIAFIMPVTRGLCNFSDIIYVGTGCIRKPFNLCVRFLQFNSPIRKSTRNSKRLKNSVCTYFKGKMNEEADST